MAVSISVVLPTFNAETTVHDVIMDLAEAVNICRSAEVELIIVDDASADRTVSVVCNTIERIGETMPRLWTARLLRQQENRGVCAARERASRVAVGDFVWFIDSDDRIPSSALESFVTHLLNDSVDIAIGGSCSIEEGAEWASNAARSAPATTLVRTGPDSLRALMQGQIRGQLWDKIIRRTLINESAFSGTKVHSDIPITAVSLSSARSVIHFDELVYGYTVRKSSIIGAAKNRAPSVVACAAIVLDQGKAYQIDKPTMSYFEGWFVGLSLLRDLQSSSYSEHDRKAIEKAAKSAIRPSAIAIALRLKAYRRAFALALALVSGSAFTGARLLFRVRRSANRSSYIGRTPKPAGMQVGRWTNEE